MSDNLVEINVTTKDRGAIAGMAAQRRELDQLRMAGVRAGDAVAGAQQRMADRVVAAQKRVTTAAAAEESALKDTAAAVVETGKSQERGADSAHQLAAATDKSTVAYARLADTQRKLTASTSEMSAVQRRAEIVAYQSAETAAVVAAAQDKIVAAKRRLAVAYDAELDVAERVRAAQAAVDAEMRAAEPNVEKLAAANARLESAQRKVALAADVVRQATVGVQRAQTDLTASVEKSVRDAGERAKKEAEKAGSSAGGAMSSGMARGLMATAPVLVPAAATVGSAAGGAVVAGFGAGLIGLGAMTAAQSQEVEDHFASMATRVASRATAISKPFEPELIKISAIAQKTWDGLEPALAAALSRLAPVTTKFVGQVSAAVSRFGPALDPIARATEAVLDDLGDRLPNVVGGIADELADLAEVIEEHPEALGRVVDALGEATEIGLQFLSVLTQIADLGAKGLGKLDDAAEYLPHGRTIQRVLDTWRAFGGEVEDTTPKLDESAQATQDAARASALLADAQADAARAAAAHAKELQGLHDAAHDLIGAQLDLRGSVTQAKDDLKEYTEAAGKHGRGSREASDALIEFERSAASMKDAVIAAAIAEQEAAGGSADLAAANFRAAEQLRALAAEAKGPARDAILQQAAALDVLIAKLNAVNKTFYARIHVSTTGQVPSRGYFGAQQSYAHGGVVGGALPTAATGGARGGPVIVNEAGTESVRRPNGDVALLEPGSTVIPAGQTRAMFDQAAGAGGWPFREVALPVSDTQAGRALLDILQEAARKRGYKLMLVR